jgi:hypothetical protein
LNERIKQLAEQAGWGKGETHDDCMSCSAFDKEEFAELIVKECIDLVAKRKEQAIEESWHIDEAMTAAEVDMEEHFGVYDE